MESPILLLIFNRPDTTSKVFEAIRKAQPPRLYIAADGPRVDKAGEVKKCAETRAAVQTIDWPCEVKLLFREQNLGCQVAVSSAIDWFFAQEEKGIVLEDDCLADVTFFDFCDQMLERYKEDERVMHVSGNNFQFGAKRGEASYYFSNYAHCWGWASWRRAWKHFDREMPLYPKIKQSGLFEGIFNTKEEAVFWEQHFDLVYNKELNTVWDFQWSFAMWINHGLSILPNQNLVSNIGFGAHGTHTVSEQSKMSNIPTIPLKNIVHPIAMIRDTSADQATFDTIFKTALMYKLKMRVKRIVGGILGPR